MAIGVSARLQVLPGKNLEFENVFTQLMDAVNAKEEGCLFYALHQSREDTQTYIALEQYTDEAALQAHGKTDHFLAASNAMSSFMAAAPKIEFMDSI